MKNQKINSAVLLTFIFLAFIMLTTSSCDLQGGQLALPESEPTAEIAIEPSDETAAEPTAETVSASDPVYAIGDIGPAGGLVFYVNANFATDAWQYLEAAPAVTEWVSRQWGASAVFVGGTSGAAGAGLENTRLIVEAIGATATGRAAQLCDSLIEGGQEDWFLPSQSELNLMYQNLHLAGLGGFTAIGYWSSTEHSADNAWRQSFSTGLQSNNIKASTYRVRAIRRF